MAHTSGPWHVEPVLGEDDQQFWSDDWNGKVFCVCHPRTQCDASTVVDWINEGDARLIAAAPDLLEALEALNKVRPINWNDPEDPEQITAWSALDAAIAKAKGTTA